MSRYVDIEPLENALKTFEKRGEVAVLLDELNSVIAKYPTADVQEVVRCKDCKYQNKGQNECESWNMCEYRSWLYFPVNDDDYCSKGERNE